MELLTKYFSSIDYSNDEVIFFKDGIFGFEEYKNYILIKFENESDVLMCLQSIDEPSIAFVMLNPMNFLKDYAIELSDKDKEQLNISDESSVLVYNICVVQDELLNSTVNLKCPVIINIETRCAKQIILEDNSYPFKYPFAELINKEG